VVALSLFAVLLCDNVMAPVLIRPLTNVGFDPGCTDAKSFRSPVPIHLLVGLCGLNAIIWQLFAGDQLYLPSATFHIIISPDAWRKATGCLSAQDFVDYMNRRATDPPDMGLRPWSQVDGVLRESPNWPVVCTLMYSHVFSVLGFQCDVG
jgi:hypothetical protein